MLVQNFFIYLACLFFGFLCFSITGAGIARLLPRGLTAEPVLQPFHGLLFWVLVFSSVFTGGKTVQLAILGYFIFQAVFENTVAQSTNNKLNLVFFNAIISFVFAVPVLVIFYFFIFRGNNSITLPFMDEVFYGKLSSLMIYTGIETNQIRSLWLEGTGQNTPYHYFEIWLTAIYSRFSGISPLLSYKLLAMPTLLGIGCGILFGLARLRNLSFFQATSAVIFTLFTGLFFGFEVIADWPIPDTMKVQLHYVSDFIPMNRVKLATVFFFLSAFLFLYNKGIRKSWMPLFLSGVLWISLTPAIWCLAGLIILKQRSSIKEILHFGAFVCFSILLLLFLYYFRHEKITHDDSVVFFKYHSPRLLAGTIIYEVLCHAIILIPVLLSLFNSTFRKVILKDFVLLVPVLVGIVLHSITIGSFDSYQFVSNASGVCLPLLFFSFYSAVLTQEKRLSAVLSIPFALMICFQFLTFYKTLAYSYRNYHESYSLDFIKQAMPFISPSGTSVVTISVSNGGHQDHPRTNYTGAFFLLLDSKARIAQINTDSNGLVQQKEFQVQEAPFSAFAQNIGVPLNSEARIAFLKKFRPNVLVVNKGVDYKDFKELSSYFKPGFVDSVSGTRVFPLQFPVEK